jgi:aminopeptidase N
VITDASAQSPDALGRFVCHELAHFWSSGARSSGAENWLNEGFAEFVAARYIREVRGEGAFAPILAQWTEQSVGQPPVWTASLVRRPSARTAYRKAPLLLHRLEERIGPETMDRFLSRYMVERIATTPALLSALGDVAGEGHAAWLREELAK